MFASLVADVVSGRDRHPPQYRPGLGFGGPLVFAGIVLLILAGALGWLLP